MEAIILGGADISGFNYDNAKKMDIIAVDKGIEFAIDNNLDIKLALGDFDSVNSKYLDIIRDKNIKYLTFKKDKDMTDLELSMVYLIENNYKKAYIYGGIGSRFDHSISNIFLLKKYYNLGLKIILIDSKNTIFYTNKNIEISKIDDRYISLFPTDTKTIINLYGVKWELCNHRLEYGSSLTVSNEFKDDAILEIIEGDCLIFLSKD